MNKISLKFSNIAKANSSQQAKSRHSWWAWLAILLTPVIFWLPLWGEKLQIRLIGYEGWCCLPDNWQELEQAAKRARSMRVESNLILGAGVLLAVLLLVGVLFILYKYAIPCLSLKWLRRLIQVIVGLFAAPLTLLLFLTIILLVFHNDSFHKIRYQPPSDFIYAYAIDLVTNPKIFK